MVACMLQRLLPILLACCLVLGGCSFLRGGDKPSPLSDTPASSEEDLPPPEFPAEAAGITVETRPERVVSLTPAFTEKLYDLGLEDRLAGVSGFCNYPEAAQSLPRCGTSAMPDVELILSLEPALVFSDKALPAADETALAEAGVQVVVLPPRAGSLDKLYNLYCSISVLLDGNFAGMEAGEAFCARFQDRLDGLSAAVAASMDGAEPIPTLYLRLLDFTVATGDTVENELLESIGLANIAAGYTDWIYPADEAAGAGRKDFESIGVLFCDESAVTIKNLEQSAFYKGLNCVLKDRFVYIDATAFEIQSLRMLDELERMAASEFCYPDIAADDEQEDAAETDGADSEAA